MVAKNFSDPVKNAVQAGVVAATAVAPEVVVINNLFSKSCKILQVSNHFQRPWWSCRLVIRTSDIKVYFSAGTFLSMGYLCGSNVTHSWQFAFFKAFVY